VEFGVLGPLEARAEGRLLQLGPPKQRALLAVLLLRANRMVPVGRLLEALWPARQPPSALSNLHVYVSHLRRALAAPPPGGSAAELVWQPPGYRLVIDPAALDLHRFEGLVEEGRAALAAGDAAAAAERLRRALALWRGPALADLTELAPLAAEAAVLEERRLAAVEDRVEADLLLGRHAEVVAELEALTAEHPLRERLRAQRMLALYRSGRPAEALAVYDDSRRTLLRELGVEPSPLLQQLQRAILSGDPHLGLVPFRAGATATGCLPMPAGPCHLPPGIADFTGRAAVLALLRQVLGGEPPPWTVCVVAGKAGVGKTTLAIHVAHELRARFPDGQLYVNLRGPQGEVVGAAEALAELLRALGVEGPAIPERQGDRARLLRALLADRRVLVVLDNAAGEAQVRPLLASGPRSATLLTSRVRLDGLAGATIVDLDVFRPDEALALLSRVVGAGRVDTERDAAETICRLCGYLPLAIRVVAAKLSRRPHWPLAELAARLADERRRLDELAVGDLAVRASIALSYQQLGQEARRAFRLLALARAPSVASWMVAALLGVPLAAAEELAERLVDAQLLDPDADGAGGRRYRLHELLRLYAAERCDAEEPPAARAAAVGRLLAACLGLAELAEARLPGGIRAVARGGAARPLPEGLDVDVLLGDPLAWLGAERQSLQAAVLQACAAGQDELAWELACTLDAFLQAQARYDEWRSSHAQALEATCRAGNRRGSAHLLRSLGELALDQGRAAEAAGTFERALAELAALGDERGAAYALRGLGIARHGEGRLDEAAACLERSLAAFEQLGDRQGQAWATWSLGACRRDQGRLDEAAACLERSLAAFEQLGDRQGQAYGLRGLVPVLAGLGRLDEAAACLERSLAGFRDLGDRRGEAIAMRTFGEVYGQERRLAEADDCCRRSIELSCQIGDRFNVARAEHRLGELEQARGRLERAIGHFERCLATFRELGVGFWEARARTSLTSALRSRPQAAAASLDDPG
jgi:DNA-binding SARP family transcriptional activator